jgi:hypothetical protein
MVSVAYAKGFSQLSMRDDAQFDLEATGNSSKIPGKT